MRADSTQVQRKAAMVDAGHEAPAAQAAGKRSLSEAEAPPSAASAATVGAAGTASEGKGDWAMTDELCAAMGLGTPAVQTKAVQARGAVGGGDGVVATAERGVAEASSSLPHLDTIQRSFGGHDVTGVRAQVGGSAAEASSAIGAEAYATGDKVAFSRAPDLHTAAHEAAHVVQQRAGVHLKGGVGQAGDVYEQHADAVADAVVRGDSAEGLLSEHAGGGHQVQRREGVVQRRESVGERAGEHTERGREQSGDELERRVGTHGGDEDGSGAWGSESDDRGMTDRANHYMWTRVALAAESMGLPNAARHMRHYLGNTGAPLTVNVDFMLRDVEPLREAYDRQLAAARQLAEERVAAMGDNVQATNFQLTGERLSDVYCSQSVSRDWFFAVGGFTYWYTAEVQVVPVPDAAPRITMLFTLHMFDRYNWDQGKMVTIAGIPVKDEQLGRLHRVGLAQEYDVNGTSTERQVTWDYSGTSSAPTGTAPVAGEREGGRSDPSRERGRHFDNVRGS